MSEEGQPGAEWLRLTGHQLHVDDLRSARQVSKAWREAASSTVAAITIEAGSDCLPEATSAFRAAQKIHLVIKRAKLRLPNHDVAASDQDEADVTQDTSKSAESAMWTTKLASLQASKPQALLFIEVADGIKLSTHEQLGDLLQQLCQPLSDVQTRAVTAPDGHKLIGLPRVSPITVPLSSRSNKGVDLGADVAEKNSSSSGTERILVAARAEGPRSTSVLRPSTNHSSSRPGAQEAAKSHCELLLKLPWLPSPPKCPAAWAMLSQLKSLRTLLLGQTLTGKTVAALADAAPHLTQLSMTVTGANSGLQRISQLQKLQSLHIRAINTNHSVVSRGICGLSQLRHLHISGDLVLQPPGTGSASDWLSVQWPQLQTLVLQQPLTPAQLAALMRQHSDYSMPAQHCSLESSAGTGNSTDSSCVAKQACGLQQLSVWVQDSRDIPSGAWYDSSTVALQMLQKTLRLMWQDGVGLMLNPLGLNNEAVARGPMASAMSQLLQHPSDPDATTLLRTALLKGSSRPNRASPTLLCNLLRLRALEDDNNLGAGSGPLQPGPAAPGHAGLQQLLVRCGASCNLLAVLRQCQPQKLTVATVPAGVDIMQQAGVAVHSNMIATRTVPRPRFMILALRADTDQMLWCLKSLSIDTSLTQAGLILHGLLLSMVARSCPSLVHLQLKGILDIDQADVQALDQGCKNLKALALIDTRVQTLDYLAKTIAAIANTPEPEQQKQQRLRRLAAAWRCFAQVGILSGMAVGAWQPKRWWRILSAMATLATMSLPASQIDAAKYWDDQMTVMERLTAAAQIHTQNGSVPKLMACWLPTGLCSLHLEGCELCSHSNCLGCSKFAGRAQWDGVDANNKAPTAENCITAEPLGFPRVRVVQTQAASLAEVLDKSLWSCKQPLSQMHLKSLGTLLRVLPLGKGFVMVGRGVVASAFRLACRG